MNATAAMSDEELRQWKAQNRSWKEHWFNDLKSRQNAQSTATPANAQTSSPTTATTLGREREGKRAAEQTAVAQSSTPTPTPSVRPRTKLTADESEAWAKITLAMSPEDKNKWNSMDIASRVKWRRMLLDLKA